jgi:chromosome segregation ATPase
LKKQVDAQDARVQDLKKTALADQIEIKDLRAKLRVAEAERVGAQKKFEEAMRTKHIVNSANVARRDELQEHERRIVELETAIDVEKRRREDVETQLRDAITAKAEEEARRSSESAEARTELEQAQAEIAQARVKLDADLRHSGAQREELVVQLKAVRDMLGQTATHYGKLVSETVSKTAYDELWRERNSIQFHTFRLERKLANTEAQVAELASLMRQTRDANGLLEAELCATKEEKNALLATLEDLRMDIRSCGGGGDDSAHYLLVDTVYAAQKELVLSELEIQVALSSGDRLSVQSYAALNDELASSFAMMRTHLDAELAVSKAQMIELQTAKAVQEAMTTDLHSAQTELESTRKLLEEASSSLSAVRASEAALIQEVKELRTQNMEQTTAHKQALQKEKETVSRLASSLQQNKVAEEELRAEISQLSVSSCGEPKSSLLMFDGRTNLG